VSPAPAQRSLVMQPPPASVPLQQQQPPVSGMAAPPVCSSSVGSQQRLPSVPPYQQQQSVTQQPMAPASCAPAVPQGVSAMPQHVPPHVSAQPPFCGTQQQPHVDARPPMGMAMPTPQQQQFAGVPPRPVHAPFAQPPAVHASVAPQPAPQPVAPQPTSQLHQRVEYFYHLMCIAAMEAGVPPQQYFRHY
jgi:hypothetical protein